MDMLDNMIVRTAASRPYQERDPRILTYSLAAVV